MGGNADRNGREGSWKRIGEEASRGGGHTGRRRGAGDGRRETRCTGWPVERAHVRGRDYAMVATHVAGRREEEGDRGYRREFRNRKCQKRESSLF